MGAREVERGPEHMHATMTVTRTHCHVVITSQGGPGPLRGAGGSEGQGEVERGPWHMVATLLLSHCRTSQGVGEGGRMRARVTMLQSFFLSVLPYFSFILIVYLLGEVDIVTPILLFFSFAPHLLSVSLTFLWT